MSAGFVALAGALFMGPRTESERHMNFHVFSSHYRYRFTLVRMVWFQRRFCIRCKRKSCKCICNNSSSGSVTMVSWVLVDAMRGNKVSSIGACIGAVVGLVAITPACGFVNVGESIAIGAIASGM